MPAPRTPSPQDQTLALSRVQTHAKQSRYIGKKGVKEIRGHVKGSHLYLEAIKQAKEGLVGRIFKMGSTTGIARLARLEFLGPNKWKFLIYDHESGKYVTYPQLREGTIEECLDAVAKVYLI
jgi:hypothetical protein